ncbi:acyl-coenzyme A thioesterase 13 isoform X1 [Natator depressus]|uniref:acyl-coenzyme A thioesterase 13 isoform X1 n=1 Tax=Natator depressus TaxID=27790 RepID=UPI003EB804EC
MSSFTIHSFREMMKVLLSSSNFDRVLSKMTVLSATPGKVVCEMKIEEEHTNRGGTLHGGLTATLVDVVSTAALLYTERGLPGVSVDMNITIITLDGEQRRECRGGGVHVPGGTRFPCQQQNHQLQTTWCWFAEEQRGKTAESFLTSSCSSSGTSSP